MSLLSNELMPSSLLLLIMNKCEGHDVRPAANIWFNMRMMMVLFMMLTISLMMTIVLTADGVADDISDTC